MRCGIISDVHGNLDALKAVELELASRSVDRVICLGDVVGYGANPNECVEWVQRHCHTVIAGNHDWAATGQTPLEYFNPIAKEACLWTRSHLDEDYLEYLRELPLTFEWEEAIMVHATPSCPAEWDYLFSLIDAIREFKSFHQRICFVGHSHQVMVAVEEGKRYHMINSAIHHLKQGVRYIVNVGSVGQPRDLDPRASFGIYDTDKESIEIVRVPYKVENAQEKILKAGLPEFLAIRLAMGR